MATRTKIMIVQSVFDLSDNQTQAIDWVEAILRKGHRFIALNEDIDMALNDPKDEEEMDAALESVCVIVDDAAAEREASKEKKATKALKAVA